MINVSNEFRKTMRTKRDFREYADITLASGKVLNLEAKDFTISNNSIVDGAGASALPLGEAIEKSIQIEIMNDEDQFSEYDFFGAKIKLYLKFKLSETTETINKGTYTVVTPESYGTVISITAVDDMYKADREYDTTLVYPASVGEIMQDACQKCGISLLTSTFANSNIIVPNKPESGDTTYRQIIGYCAMFAAGNARVDVNGYLSVIPYDMSAFESYDQLDGGTFDEDSYDLDDKVSGGTFNPWTKGNVYDGGTFLGQRSIHVLYSFKNLTVDTDDLIVTGVQITNEDNEVFLSGQEGYMFAVENPLFSGIEQSMANYLGSRLIGLRMRKFSGDHVADPTIEFFDLAYIIDRKQNIYQTIITDVDFSYFGWTSLKNSAESTIRNSSSFYSAISKAVVKARKETEQQISDYDLAVQRLTSLITQSFGVYKTEEALEDGSTVYYMHNKPTLAESNTIWKMTADAFAVSTDGGKTWNAGMDSSGNAVVNVLSAIGISFDWARGGTLTLGGQNNINGILRILNASGAQIGKWDKDGISATSGTFSGDLSAAGGTFKGNLSAAGGTFSGDLSAAGGTFKGNLSAAGGTFSGDLSAAGGTFKGDFSVNGFSEDKYPIKLKNSAGAYFGIGGTGFLLAKSGHYIMLDYDTTQSMPRLYMGTYTSIDENTYAIVRDDNLGYFDADGAIKTVWTRRHSTEDEANVHISSASYLYRVSSSSKRYKKNITKDLGEMNPSALYNLPVVSFKYKEGYLRDGDPGEGKNIIGFLAEDVEKWYPKAVSYEDGQPETWKTRIMIPAMLKLIQEQNERLKWCEDEIKKLKGV